jgi:recombination protein RecT
MATINSIKKAIEDKTLAPQTHSLDSLLAMPNVRKRFDEVLGKKAPGFISSIISVVNSSSNLKVSDPRSILASAAIAAALDLPINPSLGFAHIVPYSGKAQFQMGWKGFVQLAIRTGQYETMNAAKIYEGELKSWNRVTAEIELDLDSKKSDVVIGYVAFFKLTNGFRKYLYMTKEEATKHGSRYSQSFTKPGGRWQQDFDAMALKTVVKMLLSKWGILSVEMQKAIQADQAVVVDTPEGPTFDYTDAETGEAKPEGVAQPALAAATLPGGVAEDNTEPTDKEIPFGAPK